MEEEKKTQDPGNPGVLEAKEVAYAAIAERVRADSINIRRLTSLDTIASLIPEPEKVESLVAGMAGVETLQDIKLLVAAHGVKYLYSEKAISRRDAERLALGEEVRSLIAARVRDDSQKLARLTALATIAAMIPGAEPDKIDGHLALLLGDERFKDIRLIANSDGKRYLYSEDFLTANYAEILARAEVSNPYEIIAATVRNESRVYPRPTPLETFNAMVFNVNPEDARRFVSGLEKLPEYKDIKVMQASTGATYLYSDLFLDARWVKATIEWEEVGKHQNP